LPPTVRTFLGAVEGQVRQQFAVTYGRNNKELVADLTGDWADVFTENPVGPDGSPTSLLNRRTFGSDRTVRDYLDAALRQPDPAVPSAAAPAVQILAYGDCYRDSVADRHRAVAAIIAAAAPGGTPPAAAVAATATASRVAGPLPELSAPPAPPFWADSMRSVRSAKRADLLTQLSLTRPEAPTAADLAVGNLKDGRVVTSWTRVGKTSREGNKWIHVPRLVHAFAPAEGDDARWEALLAIAKAAKRQGLATVAWTDLTRADVEAARGTGDGAASMSAERRDQVLRLLECAERAGIALVNIDEVFSDAAPMRMLGASYRLAGSRTEAGTLALTEISHRFGGVAVPPSLPQLPDGLRASARHLGRNGAMTTFSKNAEASITVAMAGSRRIANTLDTLATRLDLSAIPEQSWQAPRLAAALLRASRPLDPVLDRLPAGYRETVRQAARVLAQH
jgi:hypothetical protein